MLRGFHFQDYPIAYKNLHHILHDLTTDTLEGIHKIFTSFLNEAYAVLAFGSNGNEKISTNFISLFRAHPLKVQSRVGRTSAAQFWDRLEYM